MTSKKMTDMQRNINWTDLGSSTSCVSWGNITGEIYAFQCTTLAWSRSESLYSKPFVCTILEGSFPSVLTYIMRPWHSSLETCRCDSCWTYTHYTPCFSPSLSLKHTLKINSFHVHSCPWSLFRCHPLKTPASLPQQPSTVLNILSFCFWIFPHIYF